MFEALPSSHDVGALRDACWLRVVPTFNQMDKGKLVKSDSLYEDFKTIDQARNAVNMKQFKRDTTA